MQRNQVVVILYSSFSRLRAVVSVLASRDFVSSHIVDIHNHLLNGANLFEPPICSTYSSKQAE